jgi:hypothetical protein
MELPMDEPGMATAKFPSKQSEFVNDARAELNITGLVDYTTVNGGDATTDLIKITDGNSFKTVVNASKMHHPRVVFILYNNIQSLMLSTALKGRSR